MNHQPSEPNLAISQLNCAILVIPWATPLVRYPVVVPRLRRRRGTAAGRSLVRAGAQPPCGAGGVEYIGGAAPLGGGWLVVAGCSTGSSS